MADMPKTPECDKMKAVKPKSQAIGEFLEWLADEKGYAICENTRGAREDWVPIRFNIEEILAEFFEIDLEKVEKERRAILAALAEAQG